jgi:hypothetical protein
MNGYQNPFEKCVVRVFMGNNVVGAGCLIANDLVLTCAHVVSTATGRDKRNVDPPPKPVTLDFPCVHPNRFCQASLASRWYSSPYDIWDPPMAATESRSRGLDVALLQLHGEIPAGVEAPALIINRDRMRENLSLSAFGFPEGHRDGIIAQGNVVGRIAPGIIQLRAKAGPRIAYGFSGCPVWAETLAGVVGLIAMSDQDLESRTAGMLPVQDIVDRYPQLAMELGSHSSLITTEPAEVTGFITHGKPGRPWHKRLFDDD